MKDKTTAGILALFIGGLGVHRFYLNQTGLGIIYITLTIVTCGMAYPIINLIDALVFFFMDSFEFDHRYNKAIMEQRRLEAKRREQKRQQREEQQERRRTRWTEDDYLNHPPKRKSRKSNNPHKIEGVKKFKEYDFKGAKESFKKALADNYKDVATHFNIACCYSMEENIDKALFHLDKAVQLGYKDFDRIHQHDALAYLRAHDEFIAFSKNNYRWEDLETFKKIDIPKEDLLEQHPRIKQEEEEESDEKLDLDTPEKEKIILLDDTDAADNSLESTGNLLDDFFGDGTDDSPPIPTAPDVVDDGLSEKILQQLKELAALRDKGILTEAEFQAQKKRILK